MSSEIKTGLYSDEISLFTESEFEEYVHLNLRKIAEYRRSFDIPVIGIAGADGKTTTKRMLSSILSASGSVLETPLDCSTTTGVTSTLLQLNNSYKYAIFELGIINPSQFEMAVGVASPNIAVITNIGEAQLTTLGEKFKIADAKLELIRKLPTNGFAVLNMDDELVSEMEKLSPTSHVIKFGLNENSHFYASNIKFLGPEGISFKLNNSYAFHLPIFSSASIYNALAAISVARALGIEFHEIQNSLHHHFRHLKHRGDLFQKNGINILDHTYNATVNSVTKACESLAQFKPFSENLILVISDVSNLGPKSEQFHLNLGFYISALPIDCVITIGKNSKYINEGIKKINHTNKKLESCFGFPQLKKTIQKYLKPHTTMLMMGNKDLKLSNFIETFKKEL
jgi:UDP-N-acetylmuramoyl-tripeptide--D-alanyl-D-alanine ligase